MLLANACYVILLRYSCRLVLLNTHQNGLIKCIDKKRQTLILVCLTSEVDDDFSVGGARSSVSKLTDKCSALSMTSKRGYYYSEYVKFKTYDQAG